MSNDYRHNSIAEDFASAVKFGMIIFLLLKSLNDASEIVHALLDFICKWIWGGIRFLQHRFSNKGEPAPSPNQQSEKIADWSAGNDVQDAIRKLNAGEQMNIIWEIEAYRKRKGL